MVVVAEGKAKNNWRMNEMGGKNSKIVEHPEIIKEIVPEFIYSGKIKRQESLWDVSSTLFNAKPAIHPVNESSTVNFRRKNN